MPTPEGQEAVGSPTAPLSAVLAVSQQIGAIGPGPLADHVAHAAGFLAAARWGRAAIGGDPLPEDLSLLDLGSGGGLPGLVLAELLPSARVTLLDGRTERARLLVEHVERLGWADRLTVVAARAEVAGRDPGLRGHFDLVVARGFARPPVTAECAAPFLRPGGLLVVSEPPGDDPARWPAEGLAPLGLVPLDPPAGPRDGQARPAGRPEAYDPRSYQVLLQQALCPPRWPRRTGIPAKRPLY